MAADPADPADPADLADPSAGTVPPGAAMGLAAAVPGLGDPDGLLGGVTVLDLSAVGPAARCSRALADFGAAVVKVAPVPGAGRAPAPAPWAYGGGRSTARVCIDVRDEAGRDAFLALASRADVVLESFRPGVVDRLGIGYDAVSARNPGVVYCSTSGFGQRGPRASWAGHDLDYLAVGGFLASSTPAGDGSPPLPGATVADGAAGGLHAALSVVAALYGRWRTGRGAHLDVAVADGVLWLMALQVDEHLATGAEPGPGHDVLTGRYACYGTYRAGDGGWLAVAAIEPAFFANLCRALGLEQWVAMQYDDGAQPALREALAAAFAGRRRDEWVEMLAGADTCVAPVLSVAEAAASAVSETAATGRPLVLRARPAHGEPRGQTGTVLAGTRPPPEPVVLPDPAVTATAALLGAAGVTEERIGALHRRGVVA